MPQNNTYPHVGETQHLNPEIWILSCTPSLGHENGHAHLTRSKWNAFLRNLLLPHWRAMLTQWKPCQNNLTLWWTSQVAVGVAVRTSRTDNLTIIDWPLTSCWFLCYVVTDIILHNLMTRQITKRFPQAHKGKVSGVCYASADRLLSCGVDRTIKLWSSTDDSGEGLSVCLLPTERHTCTHIPLLSLPMFINLPIIHFWLASLGHLPHFPNRRSP